MKEIWSKIKEFVDPQQAQANYLDENIAIAKLRQLESLANQFGSLELVAMEAEVVAIEIHDLEQIQQVIDALLAHQSVLLNLKAMAPIDAQRAVDLISGSTYALNGHQESIGENIFLFTLSPLKVSRQR